MFFTEAKEALFINQYVQSFFSVFLPTQCNREGEEDVEGGREREGEKESERDKEREREREQNPLMMARNAFP